MSRVKQNPKKSSTWALPAGLAGDGARDGLAVAGYEVSAGFMIALLGWIFAPIYMQLNVRTPSNVASVPHERAQCELGWQWRASPAAIWSPLRLDPPSPSPPGRGVILPFQVFTMPEFLKVRFGSERLRLLNTIVRATSTMS